MSNEKLLALPTYNEELEKWIIEVEVDGEVMPVGRTIDKELEIFKVCEYDSIKEAEAWIKQHSDKFKLCKEVKTKKCPVCKRDIEESELGSYKCLCGYREFKASVENTSRQREEVHELKTLPKYFKEVVEGSKTFEVRKDDRDFQVGDWLKLREYNSTKKKYTGDYLMTVITYILGRNEDEKIYVPDGYVILGIKVGI